MHKITFIKSQWRYTIKKELDKAGVISTDYEKRVGGKSVLKLIPINIYGDYRGDTVIYNCSLRKGQNVIMPCKMVTEEAINPRCQDEYRKTINYRSAMAHPNINTIKKMINKKQLKRNCESILKFLVNLVMPAERNALGN